MKRNYEVTAVIRENLTADERDFISAKIEEFKNKFQITQEGNVFYREQKQDYDDIGPCVSFLFYLRRFKDYFQKLGYKSYVEGTQGEFIDDTWTKASILKEDKDIWNTLYEAAVKVQNPRTISPFIDAGGVAAAILTKAGNIYVGVCIDTSCTLGMCAERNAIANMITNGESKIDKVVAVMSDGSVGSPCGACREYMMQLDKDSGDIEILLDLESKRTTRLKELIPDWWGTGSFEE